MSNGIGHVWAVNAEGGDEGRPNGVGPVWIENADQLGSKLPEPEAGDTGKVLGVLNSDGDIGWVVDQEGMAQVQSDWDQTDSSQVSYIANKPSLATVATTGAYSDLSGTPTIPTVDQTYDASSVNAQSGVAVASALSSKQDTISDLSTIRSGASAGATAVQPAALNDYATTSALATGLAAKQDTISDLETIRSGASAGATAVQPGDLATVATTGSYDDLSDKPTIPSTKPLVAGSNITITENANDVTISAAGGASYTAGDGIDITANEVSVKAGTGLEIADVSGEATENLVSSDIKAAYWDPSLYIVRSLCPLTSDLLTKMAAPGGLRVTLQRDFWVGASSVVYACIYTYKSSDMVETKNRLILGSQLTQTGEYMPTSTVVTFDTNDINSASNVTLQQVQSNISNYRVGLIYNGQPASSDVNSTDTSVVTATYSDAAIILDALCVSNPLPAVTSTDDGKVLKATYSGGTGSYAWESEPVILGLTAGSNVTITEANNAVTIAATDTTYTAGNMIAIDANNSNAIGVSTTAGITDIQLVNALPANPVSTVLYLIPET